MHRHALVQRVATGLLAPAASARISCWYGLYRPPKHGVLALSMSEVNEGHLGFHPAPDKTNGASSERHGGGVCHAELGNKDAGTCRHAR